MLIILFYIKNFHHKNNVVSIINPKFQAIMTSIFQVIAVLVSLAYSFGIFFRQFLSTEGTYSVRLLITQRVNIIKNSIPKIYALF